MSVTPLYQNSLEHLLAELRRITATLSQRVQQLNVANPNEVDEFQGLYVSEEEVNELLADPALFLAGSYDYQGHEAGEFLNNGQADSRLGRLQRVFGLSPFELDVLLIALAPELDLRYEKLYIYLQDDVTRRRPSVDLTLRLLCPGLAGQVAARRCFDADAPLIKYRVIELSEENQAKQVSLLARSIKLDEGIVAYLLGETRLDARLRQLASFSVEDNSLPMLSKMEGLVNRLVELTLNAEPGEAGFVQALIGPDEGGKLNVANEICDRLGIPLIVAEANVLPGLPKAEALLRLLEREARLRGAGIYWLGFDALLKEEQATAQEAYRTVIRHLKEQSGLCFVSSSQTLPPLLGGLARREFHSYVELPTYTERQQLWEGQLGPEALGIDLESLSSRFKLSSGQIAAAANTARHAAIWRGESAPSLEDLEAACRRHSNQRLNSLARKINPQYSWNDLVLPTDQYNMLYEIYHQVKNRSLVYEKWGFDSRVALGKGLNVIFAGPSGTGKTMSAGIIAHELGMDIYKIDLSNVVSKYIGETEKNLERIFNEAGESNAILFFDEADSIFGKRSEVKDAHDRYANIETGYLLQKMEEYDGIVVLATNLRKNLDEAFIRRMHFIIEFPFPEEEDRFEIWQKVFPVEVPMGDSVDLRFMARQFKVAGGNIKNIALAAAFMAASDHNAVEMKHLIFATRREYQKMGKLCTESDFGSYYSLFKDFEPKARSLNGVSKLNGRY
jgi:SpoVK/Ycf46/Vps4 family AAA+-type ATPase